MELRQLRYFTVLAEELNFTRAAARLHISQPPLSAQIAQLEDELGVTLFLRDSRKVQLTDAGATFLRDVRRIQDRLKEATQRVRTVHAGLAGRLEIGLSGSHFLGPLPGIIGSLAETHPDIDVVLNEMAPNDQIEALRESRIDLSLSRQPVEDELLCSRMLWPDPLVVALPPRHPLAQGKQIALEALATERFVMLRRETSLFAEQLLQACAAAGFTPQVAQTVSEVPAQLSLVAAGLGVSLVPASTQAYQAQALAFRPLTGAQLSTGVHVVMRQDRRKAVIDTFVNYLIEQTPGSPATTSPTQPARTP
ncbi:LysR family transcriptional regulator [Pusillimonas sp. CC-YST705]|uniref:LysR family transcriptional regulator n=1 Tax=Mesopusillimonas faecipullorum TaxID=2755040 RepID=A0ABS8CE69_9BURK|nr:LysR substrate-binding domain-containing protein [Mesopusillimonas faecipullorum]MCB5364341.1 LysR family transcriptional regulator [Mesopusillimonas faecipullorum]